MGHPKTAAEWIQELELIPHPEGGFYRETYRSSGQISPDSLPEGMEGDRSYGTAIYFLLTEGQVSKWHRIRSDELWFFHAGAPLEIVMIKPDGSEHKRNLGLNLHQGQLPQVVVPAGSWFGSRIVVGRFDYSLVSCTVSPGFDFRDFQLASTLDTEKWPALWKHPELLPLGASPRP